MNNVIYFTRFGLGLYYDSLRDAFCRDEDLNVFIYGPGYPNYDPKDNINDVTAKSPFDKVDLLFFSAGWDIDTTLGSVDPHPNINVSNCQIPKFYLLNKEYKKLNLRLEYAELNKFDLCFTVHHLYKKWSDDTGLRFERLPFAANEKVFKDYKQDKHIDLGFSGSLHNYIDEGNDLSRFKVKMMGESFQNIRERALSRLINEPSIKVKIYSTPMYGELYAKTMNASKSWLCTPSAIDIVGTRFYEIMGSKTLLFCPESKAYEGLFTPEKHCATFNHDLSDIGEKLLYYLDNDKERELITSQAYEHFLKNHTWKNRIDSIKNNL